MGRREAEKRVGRSAWPGVASRQWEDWRWQYRNRICAPDKLAALVGSATMLRKRWETVAETYPLAVTPYYLSLIDPADPRDPLARQCFPDPREVGPQAGGQDDPLDEQGAMPVPGLIHRYPDRCLAIVTGCCAVYCRHCNRKRLWQKEAATATRPALKRMVDYVARTPQIREVILSGGDPLFMPEKLLAWLLGALRAIPHVEVLRIGSRAPVTLPMRVTPELCALLKSHRPLWLNTHFNHAREITPEAARACERLLECGIPVSNQAVLLKGVNDDYETMRDLLTGLEGISVRPYYLFQCDPVRGTGHLQAEVWKGMAIMERLWRTVSGLCLPRYVIDSPGGRGKIPLQPFSLLPERPEKDKHSFDNGG